MQDHSPPTPPGPPAQYEFTPEQNRIIEELAAGVGLTGLVVRAAGFVYAALTLASFVNMLRQRGDSVIVLLLYGLATVLLLVFGYWMYQAGRSFSRVVDTAGADIAHLMEALRRLRNLFMTTVVLIAVGGGIGLVLWVLHLFGIV